MSVPGWKSAKRAGRWARSRFTGAALILGYHRISDVGSDPFGLCVSPRHFAEQMAVLRTKARPAALAEIVDGLARGDRVRGCVAVTFDDGYTDIPRNAEPVLRRFDIPATVFVVSGFTGRRLWWDELARLVLDSSLDGGTIDAAFANLNGDSSSRPPHDWSLRSRHATLKTLHRWLLECGVDTREEFMNRVRALRGTATVASAGDDVIGDHDLARLSRSQLITVGSHTVTHPALAAIPEHEQLYELRESRRQLETITGEPVRELSYPHGSHGAATRRLARQCGYRSACASTPDAVSRTCDRFCLPRFWVPDWDGERFARWLSRWQI